MQVAFIGRRRELATLAEASSDVLAGERRLVTIAGGAGAGKTTLARRVADDAQASGLRVVWGRCWPHGGAPPFWPWQAILTELLGADEGWLLASDPTLGSLEPERFARFAEIAARLRGAVERQPSMIVIDDVHAADLGALVLVRFLARALERAPLMLLLLRREEVDGVRSAAADVLTSIDGEGTVITLAPFDLGETRALLQAHGDADPDLSTVAALRRLSGGSPLLLSRAISRSQAAGSVAAMTRASLDAIDGLPEDVRAVLGIAALTGSRSTIGELTALTHHAADRVHSALTYAADRALVTVDRGEISFTHDTVREAALATVRPERQLQAHADMATLLADDDRLEHLARRAHHALAAASRSADDAVIAVEAAMAAARAMMMGFGYEAAAALFSAASDLSGRLPRRAAWSGLPVEHAEAVLACGDLGQARQLFSKAVELADLDGDLVQFARAAAGLGGVWLNEHRDPLDHRRMIASQRRALAMLGEQHHPLRCRLAVRLAAEAVYDGGSVADLMDAVEEARRVGDERVLAEALSLTHHALLAPGAGGQLLALSDELITVASSCGDGLLAVIGLMWRTVDQFQLAMPEAERSLAQLRQRIDAVGCRNIGYVVAAIDVMRLIRSGDLAAAEAAAGTAFDLGLDAGDADATGYYAAQLMTIRYLQGRDSELLDYGEEIAMSPLVMARERGLRASVAAIAARAGELSRARTILAGLTVADIEPSSTSLVALTALAEAARLLGDAELARAVYQELEPHARLPVTPSLAVTCLGSVERSLGHAAMAFGDATIAVDHFERALAANEQLGHWPMVAVTRADLADALMAVGGGSGRVRDLLAAAHAAATSMGMTAAAAGWKTRLDAVGDRGTCSIERSGTGWLVSVGERRVIVADAVGMGYLKALVDQPGRAISALDLCGARVLDGHRHELVDRATLTAYRRRSRELDVEIADAESQADLVRAERLRDERDRLRDQLSEVLGIGGSARSFAANGERARTAVQKALTRSIESVASADDVAGAHLRASITTGRECWYRP